MENTAHGVRYVVARNTVAIAVYCTYTVRGRPAPNVIRLIGVPSSFQCTLCVGPICNQSCLVPRTDVYCTVYLVMRTIEYVLLYVYTDL